MSTTATFEALAVIETGSIARGFVVLDAVVKRAPVSVRIARPVSPGRFLLVFGGGVDVTLESVEEARSVAGSDVVDELFLPGAHPALLPAIDRAIAAEHGEAVGIVETSTVSAAVLAADTALKAVDVRVLRMHLALGTGGKGWFTLCGPVADVDAALDAVRAGVRADRVIALERIAQPHAEVRGFFS
jgi:microcompartment protein CcmL/EutN